MPGIQYGTGPEYEVRPYVPHDYKEHKYTSDHRYNHIHEYNHIHKYDKIHTYDKIRKYDHVHVHDYEPYKPQLKPKPQRKPPPARPIAVKPQRKPLEKPRQWAQLHLCYQLPMGPEYRVEEYQVKKHEFKMHEYQDSGMYMDRKDLQTEYMGSVNYAPIAEKSQPNSAKNTKIKERSKASLNDVVVQEESKKKRISKNKVVPIVAATTDKKQKKQTDNLINSEKTTQEQYSIDNTKRMANPVIVGAAMTSKSRTHRSPTPLPDRASPKQENSPAPILEEKRAASPSWSAASVSVAPIIVATAAVNKGSDRKSSPSPTRSTASKVQTPRHDSPATSPRRSRSASPDVPGMVAVAAVANSSPTSVSHPQSANEPSGTPKQEIKSASPVQSVPEAAVVAAAVNSDVGPKKPVAEEGLPKSGTGDNASNETANRAQRLPPEVVAALNAYNIAHIEYKGNAVGSISRSLGITF